MPPPETLSKVKPIDIDHEMRAAYLDYAMSVIVARALPDVRDGLKPVHRRILFAMHSMGLDHSKPHRKSARIVGEVLGKFHPHGDAAVYDAMVRLAQPFSMRYPLVDGQGNFGSMDGDNAAAMRYTEARLSEIAGEMLRDIEKETVEFGPNFDETMQEPLVLPAALPNLLVNGSSGIAVGMATNLPPHNLGEVVDALCFMIDHFHTVDDVTLEHLTYFIKGPDFPTGGVIYRYRDSKEGQEDVVAKSYASGRAQLTMQAKVHIEAMSRSKTRLVITALPYQTTNSRVVERIAELVRDGRIEGISDLRDESDRQGMRIVVELTRNVEPKDVLEQLYKYTPMQQTFGYNALALVDGEPRLLSLKRMLQLFIEHRQEIVRRRTVYDLARARERAHILEGLLIALKFLDEVIALIRQSPNTEAARERLMARFKLSEMQAQAILDMPLKRLSKLEREKLEAEHKELLERIRYFEDLLAHPNKMLGVIRQELTTLKEKYGDARRTQIVDRQGATLMVGELLPEEEVLVLLTKQGSLFRQSLAGRRRGSLPRKTADAPIAMAAAPAKDSVFLFTAGGQAVQKRIHQIPTDEGVHFSEITELRPDDSVIAMLDLAPAEDGANGDRSVANGGGSAAGGDRTLLLMTRDGRCKRVAVSELLTAAHTTPLVMNVEAGDALISVTLCDAADDILLVSRLGQAIRFGQDEVRVMGLGAAGVLAMKLTDGDRVAGVGLCKPKHEVVLLTTRGFGMRTAVDQYPQQKRYGSGVLAMRPMKDQGAVEAVAIVNDEPEMFAIMRKGPMRVLRLADVPQVSRAGRARQVAGLADAEGGKGTAEGGKGAAADVQLLLALTIPKVAGEGGPFDMPPAPVSLPAPLPAAPPESETKAEQPKARASAKVEAPTSARAKPTARPATPTKAEPPANPASKTSTADAKKVAAMAVSKLPEVEAPDDKVGRTRQLGRAVIDRTASSALDIKTPAPSAAKPSAAALPRAAKAEPAPAAATKPTAENARAKAQPAAKTPAPAVKAVESKPSTHIPTKKPAAKTPAATTTPPPDPKPATKSRTSAKTESGNSEVTEARPGSFENIKKRVRKPRDD